MMQHKTIFHLTFLVNTYLFPNVSSRGVIPFTRRVTITRKYLKSFADRIEHGANIDDQDGATALTYTVSCKQKEMAEILI